MGVKLTPLGAASVKLAEDYRVEVLGVDSSDQSRVLLDRTGANSVLFSQILEALSPDQIRALAESQGVRQIVEWSEQEALGG